MKLRKPIDAFLAALAVGAAVGVLLRRTDERPPPAETAPPPTRRQWMGSLLATVRSEIRNDETVLIAAAMAFYALLALVPAAIAAVSIYGLVLDPADLADQIETITGVLPESAKLLVTGQIEALAAAPTAGLGAGLVLSVLGVLWVASSGTRALLHGINIVYNVEERRRWITQRALAYGLTLGLIVFGVVTTAVVTFLPDWLSELGFGETGVLIVEIARWPTIFVVVVLGLATLYRIGPNRINEPDQRLLPGAVTAAVLWVLATAGFSVYTGSGLSSFDVETYGTLVSVVVLLFWFFASGFVILLGAEVNASLEVNGRRP